MMWRLTDNMEGNSSTLISVMGRETFLLMAKDHLEKHLFHAVAAERKGRRLQAEAHLSTALQIENDILRVETGRTVA